MLEPKSRDLTSSESSASSEEDTSSFGSFAENSSELSASSGTSDSPPLPEGVVRMTLGSWADDIVKHYYFAATTQNLPILHAIQQYVNKEQKSSDISFQRAVEIREDNTLNVWIGSLTEDSADDLSPDKKAPNLIAFFKKDGRMPIPHGVCIEAIVPEQSESRGELIKACLLAKLFEMANLSPNVLHPLSLSLEFAQQHEASFPKGWLEQLLDRPSDDEKSRAYFYERICVNQEDISARADDNANTVNHLLQSKINDGVAEQTILDELIALQSHCWNQRSRAFWVQPEIQVGEKFLKGVEDIVEAIEHLASRSQTLACNPN